MKKPTQRKDQKTKDENLSDEKTLKRLSALVIIFRQYAAAVNAAKVYCAQHRKIQAFIAAADNKPRAKNFEAIKTKLMEESVRNFRAMEFHLAGLYGVADIIAKLLPDDFKAIKKAQAKLAKKK